MKKGFYMPIGWKDCFIVTGRKNKTARLATDIINALGGTANKETIKHVLYRLHPAVLEVKETPSGRKYNDIHGAGFGGHYGHFVDEYKDIIVVLD